MSAFAYLPPAALAVSRLGPRDCRWPLGRPDGDGFAFCGGPRTLRSSYCDTHAGVARVASRPRGPAGLRDARAAGPREVMA